jgi:hypothetical protein
LIINTKNKIIAISGGHLVGGRGRAWQGATNIFPSDPLIYFILSNKIAGANYISSKKRFKYLLIRGKQLGVDELTEVSLG